MSSSGIETKKAKEKTNVIEDNISKRKHKPSIAPAILNIGREFASASLIFLSLNLDSLSKLLMVVAPEIISENVVSLELCTLQLTLITLVT